MDKASIAGIFKAHGLERLLKDIDLLVRPSIRLHTCESEESANGISRLGGLPDLPPGTSWPEWQGVPQSFIAQVRLSELHPYDTEHLLPEDGMLWFFYDARQQTFGESPADRGGWRVLFVNGDPGQLRQTPAPEGLPQESRFRPCPIGYTSELTLPQQPELEIPHFDWTPEEQQRYEQLLSIFPSPADHSAIHNRMFGHPDTLQDDMRTQCQLVTHGITDSTDPRATELEKGMHDWLLLLQVDSDEHAGMRWANNGLLYYWITKADLQARHFDATWLVLQSE